MTAGAETRRRAGEKKKLKRSSSPEELLGHSFADAHLLELALTHRSFAYETEASDAAPTDPADPGKDNEQLEFLGDAVLGMLAAESLIHHFPRSREGELTRLRASIVSRKYLGKVGLRLDLGRWLRLGKTGSASAVAENSALLANTVEALIAAMYLDGGLRAAQQFVEREIVAPALPQLLRSVAEGSAFSGAVGDFKSVLQEMLQAGGQSTPEYHVVEESGPGHRKLFRVEVRVAGEAVAQAEGRSKKEAQQEAARLATELLRARTRPQEAGVGHG